MQRHVAALSERDRNEPESGRARADRFHVMKLFGKALDEIRADEMKRLKRDGHEPVLTRSRWCILKRPENLTPKQDIRLKDLLRYNLRTVKCYLMREDFQ